MAWWFILILVLAFLLFLYLCVCLVMVFLANNKLFGIRGEDPSNPCYLQFSDYEDALEREDYMCGYYGKAICGYIYTKKGTKMEDSKGLIIFAHGLFGTHIQYLLDISFLVENGYSVLAYDQYGAGLSDGKSQEYLAHGIYVMENVLHDVKKRNINKGLPLFLYGHSWGGYSATGAMRNYPEIKGVIERSGPCNPITAGKDVMKTHAKTYYNVIRPFYTLSCFLLLGFRFSISALRGPKKNKTTKLLCIQAKNDGMVKYEHSIAHYFEEHPQSNVEVMVTENGLHNTILEEVGNHNYETKVKEFKEIMTIEDKDEKKAKLEKFISQLDRKSLYPYNKEVCNKILTFLDDCLDEKKAS